MDCKCIGHKTKKSGVCLENTASKYLVALNSIDQYVKPHRLGQALINCSFCKALMYPESFKINKKTGIVSSSTCCKNGTVVLESLNEMLPEMVSLMQNTEFIKSIRKLNNTFSFSSAQFKSKKYQGLGGTPFNIHGVLHTNIVNSVKTSEKHHAKFLQVYMYDPDIQNHLRISHNTYNDELLTNKSFIEELTDIFLKYSKLAKTLRTVGKTIEQSEKNNLSIENVNIILAADPTKHKGTQNKPTVKEIAIIITGDLHAINPNCNRDVLITLNNGKMQKVSTLSECYDPLRYVMMFPQGDPGWRLGLTKIKTPILVSKFKKIDYESEINSELEFSGYFY